MWNTATFCEQTTGTFSCLDARGCGGAGGACPRCRAPLAQPPPPLSSRPGSRSCWGWAAASTPGHWSVPAAALSPRPCQPAPPSTQQSSLGWPPAHPRQRYWRQKTNKQTWQEGEGGLWNYYPPRRPATPLAAADAHFRAMPRLSNTARPDASEVHPWPPLPEISEDPDKYSLFMKKYLILLITFWILFKISPQ